MRVKIQSPDGINMEIQNVEFLSATLLNGYPISILPNHAPLIGQISAGNIKYKISKIDHIIPISDGILFVQNNLIKILTIKTNLPDQ